MVYYSHMATFLSPQLQPPSWPWHRRTAISEAAKGKSFVALPKELFSRPSRDKFSGRRCCFHWHLNIFEHQMVLNLVKHWHCLYLPLTNLCYHLDIYAFGLICSSSALCSKCLVGSAGLRGLAAASRDSARTGALVPEIIGMRSLSRHFFLAPNYH